MKPPLVRQVSSQFPLWEVLDRKGRGTGRVFHSRERAEADAMAFRSRASKGSGVALTNEGDQVKARCS